MSSFLDLTGLTYFYQKLKDKFALKSQQLHVIANKTLNTSTGSMDLSSVNLNTVVTSGFYNAVNCTNSKYTAATLIVVGYTGTTSCTQIEIDIVTGELASRSLNNGTWGAWQTATSGTTTLLDISHNGAQTVTFSGVADITNADSTSY